MSKRELPKTGDRIPREKFFVSKMNARFGESFGDKPEDEALKTHLTWRDIVQPFIARPEDKKGHWEPGMDLDLSVGYGVYLGRRRFLGKDAKEFVVGKDCLIREVTDEEALDASLRENLELFRSTLNPVTKARKISELINSKVITLRGLARLWRIPVSTLSEWLQPNELSLKLQDAGLKDLIHLSDMVQVARLKLGTELQDKLAETVETQGYEAFKSEVARLQAGKGKRGIRP